MKPIKSTTLAVSGVVLGASLLPLSQAVAEEVSLSANIGAVSNYIWRGASQTSDGAAVQGGLDAGMGGFYIGTWASNIDFGDSQETATVTDVNGNDVDVITSTSSGKGTEVDIYAGYDFTLPVEEASLGVSATYYAYPQDTNTNFAELGISGGYGPVYGGIQYTVWGGSANKETIAGTDYGAFVQGDVYYSIGADLPISLPADLGISIYGGFYDFKYKNSDDVNQDYTHYGASISKDAGDFGSFAFNFDKIDPREDAAGYDTKSKFWVSWSKEF